VIQESQENTEFQFVHHSFNRTMLSSTKLIERRTDLYTPDSMTTHHLMLSTLIDTLLLAEADTLIAHFLSNMSRLALELSAAAKGRVPPYISVDGPWCPHWKMCPR
jgi:hypothetical protein